jgi:hypothetical protein
MAEEHVVHELRTEAPAPLGLAQAGAVILGLSACAFLVAVARGGISGVGAPSTGGLSSPASEVVIAMIGLLGAVGLAFMLQAARRQGDSDVVSSPPRGPLWQRLLVFAGMIAVLAALFAAVLTLLPAHSIRGPDVRPGGGPTVVKPHGPTLTPGGPLDASSAQWVALGVGVLLGVLVLVALYRHPRRPPAAQVEDDALERTIAAGIGGLESEQDPRRAVIKAYAGMERVLAGEGLPRRPSETSVEFLRRALTRLKASRSAARRLTSLFERAKFSQHPVDESMRREALGALADLRSELEE